MSCGKLTQIWILQMETRMNHIYYLQHCVLFISLTETLFYIIFEVNREKNVVFI